MSKKGRQNYFRGDEWFQQQVNTRVKAVLAQKEVQFAEKHKDDTDEQLLDYLLLFYRKYGYTPNPGEMIGGRYICQRFGSWDCAVSRARLPRPGKQAQLTKRAIYKEEFQRQAALFKQERQEDKAARQTKRMEASQVSQDAKKEREMRDLAWGEKHAHYTQEQLSAYLQQCAEDLGHTPVMREVVGGAYIAKRFVCWPLALTIAELPLPQGMKPPKNKDFYEYQKRNEPCLAEGL